MDLRAAAHSRGDCVSADDAPAKAVALRYLLAPFRLVAALAGFAASLAFGAWLVVLGRSPRDMTFRVARAMARWTCGWSGTRVIVRGAEHLAMPGPFVVASNHQGYADYPIFATVFPEGTVVVAKTQTERIPVVGWLFKKTGQLAVDRRDPTQSHAIIDAAAERIRREGLRVWMFPEGTRNKGNPRTLLPFRRGTFVLAQSAGVPIVPVVLSPLRPWYELERLRVMGGPVTIQVLPPIAPSAGATPLELQEIVRNAMQETLHRF